MSMPSFNRIPSYPLPTSTPFTRQTAFSFIERLEDLYVIVREAYDLISTRDVAYQKLISDANTAITSALEIIKNAQDDEEANAAEVRATLAALVDALDRLTMAESSLDTASNNFNTKVAELQDMVTAFGKRIDALEIESATHVAKDHIFIDATDHGAKGDGVADDTEAIRAAVALAGPGGKVYLPKGRYKLTGTVKLPVSCVVEGIGRDRDMGILDGAVVEWSGGAGVAFEFSTGSGLRHLSVVNVGGSGVASSVGVRAVNISGFVLDDVLVREFATGLLADSVWYARIFHCDFTFNVLGMDITYCYNFDVQSSRFFSRQLNAARTGANGAPEKCVVLNSRCMVKFNHTAFEGYSTAITIGVSSSSVTVTSSYFEAPGNQTDAVGVRARSGSTKNNITFTGNDIYITNHHSFFSVGSQCTEKLVSIGNRIVGGNEESACIYLGVAMEGGPLRLVALGDSVLMASKVTYIPDMSYIPGASLVLAPYGGSNVAEGLYSTGDNWLGVRTVFKPSNGLPGGMSEKRAGTVVYDETRKALVLFNGVSWTRPDGTAL